MGAQLGEGLGSVNGLAGLHLLDAFPQGGMKLGAVLVVEVVAPVGQHFVEGDQLNNLAFGEVRGLIEHEPAVVDVGFERLHRSASVQPSGHIRHGPSLFCGKATR